MSPRESTLARTMSPIRKDLYMTTLSTSKARTCSFLIVPLKEEDATLSFTVKMRRYAILSVTIQGKEVPQRHHDHTRKYNISHIRYHKRLDRVDANGWLPSCKSSVSVKTHIRTWLPASTRESTHRSRCLLQRCPLQLPAHSSIQCDLYRKFASRDQTSWNHSFRR